MGHATRDLQKEAAWRRRLREQATSGQSVRGWCRRHRVTEAAFYWWRRELARRDAEGSGASFVPVHVTEASAGDGAASIGVGAASMEIVLTDGRRVRLSGPVDQQMLIAVLDALVMTNAAVAERRSC